MYRIIFKYFHLHPESSKICPDLCIKTRARPEGGNNAIRKGRDFITGRF
jgi:hypothetical protein